MNYKVTEQYPRSKEKLIGEFGDFNDLQFFLSIKLLHDEEEHKKRIYRIYDESDLLHEINRDHLSVVQAQSVEFDLDLMNDALFLFSVVYELSMSGEKRVLGRFQDTQEAYALIDGKCELDETVGDQDVFFIFKQKVLLKTYNKMFVRHEKTKGSASGAASFKPSPMPTRPTPFGGEGDCLLDDDPKDD